MTETSSIHGILHVVDSLERGGLERVVLDLALAQKAAGAEPRVFCLYRTGAFAEELVRAGIVVTCGRKRDGIDLRALWRLRRAIWNRCDVVHAHNLVPNYYAALCLRTVWRAPVLVGTCHDMGTRLSDRHLRRMFLWSVRHTRRFAMVADAVHQSYVNGGLIPAQRADVIFNGIPLDRYPFGPAAKASARARLGLPQDALVIGAVGRLVPLKNHLSLLRALPALLSSHPSLRLVLIGGGELETTLKAFAAQQRIQDRVVFAGERSDVGALLAGFDVFAQPSTTEGMSIALLEASAAALAIIATRVGGNPRIVQPEGGVLVPASDDAALCRALDELLSDAARRSKLGEAARRWVSAHASLEAMRDAYVTLYQSARLAGGVHA
jgi:glycosyltransferase involved in cell wall biosynthesis